MLPSALVRFLDCAAALGMLPPAYGMDSLATGSRRQLDDSRRHLDDRRLKSCPLAPLIHRVGRQRGMCGREADREGVRCTSARYDGSKDPTMGAGKNARTFMLVVLNQTWLGVIVPRDRGRFWRTPPPSTILQPTRRLAAYFLP